MHATLLTDESWSADWPDWAASEGVILPDLTDAPRYSLYSLAVEEAVAGAGVLMGHGFLIEPQLAAGTLVPLFPGRKRATGRALMLDRPARAKGDLARLIGHLSGAIRPDA
jgi:LysR family glycine cleavage system transcriptional activator